MVMCSQRSEATADNEIATAINISVALLAIVQNGRVVSSGQKSLLLLLPPLLLLLPAIAIFTSQYFKH